VGWGPVKALIRNLRRGAGFGVSQSEGGSDGLDCTAMRSRGYGRSVAEVTRVPRFRPAKAA
jgi:hypothetical protein